ncbi:hypothetical protein Q4I32_007828 [Leishmania shawi]|uniref:Transmembrane protein n=2 Tax=Viannia TaxID=37616 RepID=A0AAW3B3Y3_9TRYP
MRILVWLACVAAFGLLSLVAADTVFSHDTRSHTVTIEPGVLPEAQGFGRLRLRTGEWMYSFNPGEEASFFSSEDSASRQWLEWKAELRLLQEYRQRQHLGRYSTGGEKTDTSANQGNSEGRDPTALPIVDYFADRNVRRRHAERLRKQSLYNLSDSEEAADARVLVENEIAAMWHLVQSTGRSNGTNDQEFLGLVERYFSHTLTNRSAAAPSRFLPSLPRALLRLPLVLDAEVVPFMEREVGHVRDLWKLRLADGVAPAASSDEVESQLQLLSTTIEDSKTVATAVATLVEPLADAALSWVASSLTATREAIVMNDESTEAKRSELKRLLKQQSVLHKMRPTLEKHSKVYQGVVRRGQLPNTEATLFALQLIAKQRFGDNVSGLVEAVPSLSVTAPLTGLLEQEWRVHVLAPYGICVLATATFIWLCEELKERLLSRVRARRLCPMPRSPCGMTTSLSNCARQAYMLVSLLELVVLPLLPVIVLLIHLRGVRFWICSLIALMRPCQLTVCLASGAFLLAANYLVARVVRRVFQIVSPSVYRRRLAKSK